MTPKASREILGLFVITLLLLAPLGYVVLRNRIPSALPTGVSPDSPWRTGDQSYRRGLIALSPDGRYVAALCPLPTLPPLPPTPTPALRPFNYPPSGSLPRAATAPVYAEHQLVIWRVADRNEMARLPIDSANGYLSDSNHLNWHEDGYISLSNDREFELFDWQGDTSIVEVSSNSPRPAGYNGAYFIVKRQFDIASDVELCAVRKQGTGSKSPLRLEAFRIKSGEAIPVRQPAALPRGLHNGINLAVRPAPPGSPLQAVLVVGEPTPTPNPTATPIPTPTPSKVQREFLQKEARVNQEVEVLVNRLMAEDGPTGHEADEMEARVNSRNAEVKAERERLFGSTPPLLQYRQPVYWTRVLQWDAPRGKILWQLRFSADYIGILPSWSPDGKILALIGTGRVAKSGKFGGMELRENRGIEFLDGRTGRRIASSTLTRGLSWDTARNTFWLPNHILVVKDSDAQFRPVLRFLNVLNGQTIRLWPLQDIFNRNSQVDSFSTDSTGSIWAFASGQSGWRTVTTDPLSPQAVTTLSH